MASVISYYVLFETSTEMKSCAAGRSGSRSVAIGLLMLEIIGISHASNYLLLTILSITSSNYDVNHFYEDDFEQRLKKITCDFLSQKIRLI